MLEYWEKDPATKVILLYLESFDNPDVFTRISRRVSMTKPILAIKGGNTMAGSRTTHSHTGAMVTPDLVSDALFRQAGIVRVTTIEQLFHSAMLFASQPVPTGKRVAILTIGGGRGTLAADACSRNGLIIPELSDETVTRVKAAVKRDMEIGNPLNLSASVTAGEFENTLKILTEDPGNDALITIYVPSAGLGAEEIEGAIEKAMPVVEQRGKPILCCFMGHTGSQGKVMAGGRFVPYYPFPEDAALALANAAGYGEMAGRKRGTVRQFAGVAQARGREIVMRALTSGPERPLWVSPDETCELLSCYGIRTVASRIARTAEDAAAAACQLGFPVAIKLYSSTISHKSDVGGVVLNVRSADEAKHAYDEVAARLTEIGRGEEMEGVTVQPMIDARTEAIVGVTEDATLGHVMMFGLGGVYAELVKDVTASLVPLTDLDAREMIDSVKMIKLLRGYRGAAPLDTEALEDLLLRVSALVEDLPQITEMDLNPVKILPKGQGYRVVDARIMLK